MKILLLLVILWSCQSVVSQMLANNYFCCHGSSADAVIQKLHVECYCIENYWMHVIHRWHLPPGLGTEPAKFWACVWHPYLAVFLKNLGRLRGVYLIKWASTSVRPYVHMSVRSYVRLSTESFWFEWNWCVGRGRWVMHDGMPCGPFQGQGHVVLNVRNSFSESMSSAIFSWFVPAGFLISVLVFVSRDFWTWKKLRCDFRKVFSSGLSEIWYVGRGRWAIHDGMPCGAIQGQGHMALKVINSSIFKIYLVRHFQWELANDCWFFN